MFHHLVNGVGQPLLHFLQAKNDHQPKTNRGIPSIAAETRDWISHAPLRKAWLHPVSWELLAFLIGGKPYTRHRVQRQRCREE